MIFFGFLLTYYTLFLTICAITSIGFVSAAFILVFKKGDPLNWGFSVLSWLLGGVYYPITVLPEWLQHLALSHPSATAWKRCGYVCWVVRVTGPWNLT
jgi:ABC-type polysaccharide/polyol phosphate export permease